MPVPVATRLVNSPLIGIIGLPRSNSASVVAAFRSIGKNAVIIGSEKELTSSFDAIVLPGVGRFGPAAQYLGKSNLGKRVRDLYSDGISIMGICLGMQLLGDSSEESPGAEGLGILSMVSSRLSSKKHGLVPNVGWHEVTFQSQLDPSGEKAAGWFYFSHSYHVSSLESLSVASIGQGPSEISVAVQKPGAIGVQFHPERSGKPGLQFLKNFAEGLV